MSNIISLKRRELIKLNTARHRFTIANGRLISAISVGYRGLKNSWVHNDNELFILDKRIYLPKTINNLGIS